MKSEDLYIDTDFCAIAWRDFIAFAMTDPDIREQFQADTNQHFIPATTPLEAAIDDATGATEHWAHEFIRWATVRHWGLDMAPRSVQDKLATLEED